MYTTNDVIIIGTSELRSEGAQLLVELKKKKVILTQKGKPIGVIEDFTEYQKKEKKIEEMEDLVLGFLAKERMRKNKKFISSEQLRDLIFAS